MEKNLLSHSRLKVLQMAAAHVRPPRRAPRRTKRVLLALALIPGGPRSPLFAGTSCTRGFSSEIPTPFPPVFLLEPLEELEGPPLRLDPLDPVDPLEPMERRSPGAFLREPFFEREDMVGYDCQRFSQLIRSSIQWSNHVLNLIFL